jgi:poly-gamma-glutamate capsule biosynthesis protein CapA/YwtB (metallophosphatase superfamily)
LRPGAGDGERRFERSCENRVVRLALAGDTMLGHGVGERLREEPGAALFSSEVVDAVRAADLCIANLECCISERGSPMPGRVFHFRAPPAAAEALADLGVDCVTLANNHALDYGPQALLDTFEHLRAAGVRWLGAGPDERAARMPAELEAAGERLRVVAFSDHPAEYAAGERRPGIAFADLDRRRLPDWLSELLRSGGHDPVLVCPHWGPNMVADPVRTVRRAAEALERMGASLVAGHSAHVFHGVGGRVLFDLGDFVDDYRVEPALRNDLGLLWFVDLDDGRPVGVEALPLKLDFCHTRVADPDDAAWIARRLREACAGLGTSARERDGRLVVDPGPRD